MSGTCKLCFSKLNKSPILILDDMPRAAQFFPDPKQFQEDKGVSLKVFQCGKCGLVQLISEPVEYFKNVITAATLSGDARNSRLSQMKNFREKYNLLNKKVLEIGCASGSMLDVIKEAGMSAFGVEASKDSVDEGLKKGRKIIHGFIGDLKKISHGPYDAFVSFNYLEHMPEPTKVLNIINSNLSSNGLGLVTVPNFDFLLKTKCFYEFVPDHLSYFTKETISNIFLNCGFVIKEISLINNENDILVIVEKSKKSKEINFKKPKAINLSSGIAEIESLKIELKSLVKKYKDQNKKIAIWGAGHRTLALLSISNLVEIEYIVDSAKFKQGKYSPVLHTKIFSPEILKKNEIDLLIVMVPGIYPDEVIKTAKNMNLKADIAKLRDNKIEFI